MPIHLSHSSQPLLLPGLEIISVAKSKKRKREWEGSYLVIICRDSASWFVSLVKRTDEGEVAEKSLIGFIKRKLLSENAMQHLILFLLFSFKLSIILSFSLTRLDFHAPGSVDHMEKKRGRGTGVEGDKQKDMEQKTEMEERKRRRGEKGRETGGKEEEREMRGSSCFPNISPWFQECHFSRLVRKKGRTRPKQRRSECYFLWTSTAESS